MVRVLRLGIISAAILITVLDILGINQLMKSPYTGIQHHNLVVQGIYRDSPNRNLGLEPGDRIVTVEGVKPRNLNHFNYLTGSNWDLAPQVYLMARGDSTFQVTVAAFPQPQQRTADAFARMIVGLTFTLVGLIVIIKRPDILGVLFTVICIILAFLVTKRPVTSIPLVHIGGELVHDFLFVFLPAFFLHFFLIFPGKEIQRGSRRSTLARFLYLPPTVLFVVSFVLAMMSYMTAAYIGVINAIEKIVAIYWMIYIIFSIVIFIRTYVTSTKVQKIKFRLVIIGVILGILPVSAVMLIKLFGPTIEIPYGQFSVIFLSFISVSFAYAILKHGAFDLGIVFRKGLDFAILAGLLLALYYFLVQLLGRKYGEVLGISPKLATVSSIVLVALAFLPARAAVKNLIDRALSRSRQVFRDQVIDFSRKIQFMLSFDEISTFVTHEVFEMFGAEYVHLFLREEQGNYILKKSYPVEQKLPLTSFPPSVEFIRLVKDRRLPLMIEYFDNLWIGNNLDRISQELIAISHAAVVAPLIEQNALFGFILLGRKGSSKPYTFADAEILELISERSAAALWNIELYSDSMKKEKFEEELHLASDIQHRLLPEAAPELEGAKLLGGIRTSRGVGGDFYDFVSLGPGKVGLAVADVSGKGIPAALLMTTLQATFRAEALHDRSPADVLRALNGSLFERSELSKFATFFYAVYDDRSGVLHYGNAGSCPPLVIHQDGSFTRLKRGGLILGIQPESNFREGVVKLGSGDTVAVYTDGFIDQESAAGEDFGEKRLTDFFRNNLNLSLESLVEKLFATILAFGQNNVKDDMTIVLLRKEIP